MLRCGAGGNFSKRRASRGSITTAYTHMMNRYLKIEIWDGESIQWSLSGEGNDLQYDQASIRLRSLFSEQTEIQLVLNKNEVRTVEKSHAIEEVRKLGGNDNIMLTDKNYTKMMIFIYT